MAAPIVPTKIDEFLIFARQHADAWGATPAAVGLTAPQCAALATAVTDAEGQRGAQRAAEAAFRGATELMNDRVAAARTQIGTLIKIIRGFADASGDPASVYSAAQLPMPAAPAPLPPPALPTDVRLGLNAVTGALELSWKATNPGSGTSYVLRRKLAGETAFTFLGVTGTKRFVDSTLPVGVAGAMYTIQGQRSGSAGPEAQVSVQFGSVGGAPILLSVRTVETPAVKLAA